MGSPNEQTPTQEHSLHEHGPEHEKPHCLARSVVQALVEDPSLEAITIDRAEKKISVATLGKTDVPRIAERITNTFERAHTTPEKRKCTLLAGVGECTT